MPIEEILYVIVLILLLTLTIVLRKCYSLQNILDEYNSIDREKNEKVSALSKFDTLSAELTQLRKVGLSDKKYFFDSVLDSACVLINSARGSLMLYDEVYNELIIIAARNISKAIIETTHIKPGEGIAGRAFNTGEVIYITDPGTNSQYVNFEGKPEQREPFISIPIKTPRKTFCVLNLHITSEHSPFTDYDLRLLTILADEAGMIMENDQLLKALAAKK